MNYIKRLEYENRKHAAEIVGLRSTIQDLKLYLTSEKFHAEPWVNIKDIFLRLEEGERKTTELIDTTPVPE